MKDEEELAKCYGVNCLSCTCTDCELRACGVNVIREKQHEIALRFGKRDEMVTDETYVDEMCDHRHHGDYLEQFLATVEHQDPTIDELLRQAKLDTLRHVLHYWAEKPTSLEVLFRRYLYGQNQSDVARMRGVTRQNVSKEMKMESGEYYRRQIKQLRHKADVFATLSATELAVYRICFEGGCSVRSAAVQIGISPAKVHRVKHLLRLKLAKSETVQNHQNKKK